MLLALTPLKATDVRRYLMACSGFSSGDQVTRPGR